MLKVPCCLLSQWIITYFCVTLDDDTWESMDCISKKFQISSRKLMDLKA